jgi:hypothetical protein
MIKPDVIVAWPRNADYPLWRQFIRDNRERFNLVIVVFTETHQGDDYREFVRGAMAEDWVLFIDNPPIQSGQDWRDVAMKQALLHSYNSEWVWFTEQDFLIEDPHAFFQTLEVLSRRPDISWIATYDGPRLHPCCLFVRREILNQMHKDFSANPPHYDHFGAIQQQLEGLGEEMKLTKGYTHLAGLSHNMTLVYNSQEPNYKPEEFQNYLRECFRVTVPLDPRFTRLFKGYLAFTDHANN